jgi:hypothetical protein
MLPLLLTLVHEHGHEISRLPRLADVRAVHISKSDDSDNACTKIGRCVTRGVVPFALSCQCFEQRLGLLEVGGVKALGEPVIHRGQEVMGFLAFVLLLPEASEAGGSA